MLSSVVLGGKMLEEIFGPIDVFLENKLNLKDKETIKACDFSPLSTLPIVPYHSSLL